MRIVVPSGTMVRWANRPRGGRDEHTAAEPREIRGRVVVDLATFGPSRPQTLWEVSLAECPKTRLFSLPSDAPGWRVCRCANRRSGLDDCGYLGGVRHDPEQFRLADERARATGGQEEYETIVLCWRRATEGSPAGDGQAAAGEKAPE